MCKNNCVTSMHVDTTARLFGWAGNFLTGWPVDRSNPDASEQALHKRPVQYCKYYWRVAVYQ